LLAAHCVASLHANTMAEEKVDKSMATLSNRLPFMELSEICAQEGFSYAAVWRAALSKHRAQRSDDDKPKEVLRCDVRASHGEYPMTLGDWEIGERGMTSSKEAELLCGEALPWKCFKSDQNHKVEFFDNVASSSDPRKDVLRERNVRGCLAIFRDGAVYEFGQAARMEGEPEQLIKSIGGSTGVLKAATAVQAVVRLGKLAKKNKAGEDK